MLKKVLDNGVRLYLIDHLAPEGLAMLCALYARSQQSVEVALEKVMAARRDALSEAMHPIREEDDYPLSKEALNEAVDAAMQVWSGNHPTARAGKLHDRYVVGYGHRSIADCGQTALFVEGGSCILAKALQDTPLYWGQEGSTRASTSAPRSS